MTVRSADELAAWAETYGDPEDWAKRAQGAHARAEKLAERLALVTDQRDEALAVLEQTARHMEMQRMKDWGAQLRTRRARILAKETSA